MIHPNTELRFISSDIGIGVVATEFIPKGTITWAFDSMDKIYTPDELDKMHPFTRNTVDKYTYRDADGNFVLCWDHSRFVNHSFNSNCISTAYNFEMAVRDIYPGEQLTDDYGYLNILEPFEPIRELNTTRTKVFPDDLLHFYPEWDAKLKLAFAKMNLVEQPLWPFVDPSFEEKVRLVAAGKEPMDSILNCYYDPKQKNIAA